MKTYSYIFMQVKCGESVKWDDIVLPSKVFTSIEALKLGIIRHGEELARDYCEDEHDAKILVEEFTQVSEKLTIDPDCGYVNLYLDCMELILIVQRCEMVHIIMEQHNERLSG